jgi:hypothetical protein
MVETWGIALKNITSKQVQWASNFVQRERERWKKRLFGRFQNVQGVLQRGVIPSCQNGGMRGWVVHQCVLMLFTWRACPAEPSLDHLTVLPQQTSILFVRYDSINWTFSNRLPSLQSTQFEKFNFPENNCKLPHFFFYIYDSSNYLVFKLSIPPVFTNYTTINLSFRSYYFSDLSRFYSL